MANMLFCMIKKLTISRQSVEVKQWPNFVTIKKLNHRG